MDHDGRIARLRDRFEAIAVDGLLVTEATNVRYLTGFSGTNGQVLVGAGAATFFSDPRYEARAADLVHGADIVIYPHKLSDRLPGVVAAAGITRLGIEADTMPVAQRDRLADDLGSVEIVATNGVVEDLRRVKDPAEIERMRAAVALGDAAFAWIVERLTPGATERQIALELEVHMRQAGADAVSFEPIVGTGPLSAHIHHTPSERAMEKGDLVLLDLGARYDGYCSDLTRTVVLGPASDEQRAVYDLVLAAQQAGIDAVGAGAECRAVDAAARAVIEAAGHGDAFGHGLGHGVGLDIHEAPRLNRESDQALRAGDVVTVEPGVYLRNSGGVRIEDCVLVRDDGSEVLGSAPKDTLIEL